MGPYVEAVKASPTSLPDHCVVWYIRALVAVTAHMPSRFGAQTPRWAPVHDSIESASQ